MPFDSRASFKLADLLYRKVQMSEGQISELMEIIAEWARAGLNPDIDPPFADAKDLYATIDASTLGDIPWQSFTVSYDGDINEDDASWKRKSYDIWFRDPYAILRSQLANRSFSEEMDFSPKVVRDRKTKARRYQDFMSGDWAWRQAVSRFISFSKTT